MAKRALQARNGSKILALAGSSYTVKIFAAEPRRLCLVASKGNYALREITREDNFVIFGVITGIVRGFKKI